MKKLLILLCTVTFFVNCNNNGGGWSSQDRQKGMKRCMDEAGVNLDETTAKKYCSYVLEKAMQKYKSYADADKGSEEEGKELAQGCAKIVQGGNDPEDESKGKKKGGGIFGGDGDEDGGWSNADKKKYMNECIPAAVNTGVDEQRATTYCNCTLKKLEKKYKSYSDAQNNMTQTELTKIQQECAAGGNTDEDYNDNK